MLSREALETTLPLAERLDANKIILMPLPGSQLDALVRDTRASTLFNIQMGDGGVMPDIDNIAFVANTRNEKLGFSDHDIQMDDCSELVADAVRKHIAYARTVVTPVILDMVERVTTAQKNSPSISSLLGLEVVVWNPPAPLTNNNFAGSLREYEGVAFIEANFPFTLEAKSFEELVTLMETGKSSVDTDIRAWAAAKGADFFLGVWAEAFQNMLRKEVGGRPRTFYEMTSHSETGADFALAVFLLARRLIEDPPENTGLALQAYKEGMAAFRDQAALRLNAVLSELERDTNVGRLVRNISGKVTIVSGPVYKAWIEQDGSNEILFGNMLSNTPMYTVDQINGQAAALRAYWHRHETATVLTENAARLNRDLALLRKVFIEQLHELTDPNEANQQNITIITRLFDKELGMVTKDDFKNLRTLCMRLICRSRFYQTDAEFILESGDAILREFPNIDPREAYAMATIEYIIRWVLSQIKPVSA